MKIYDYENLKKDGNGVQYLKTKFRWINDVKLKEEVFVGQKIRKLIKDPSF